MKAIIIDIVTGFLGAGKTTLISEYATFRINQKERVVIIENEFGETGIDGELLGDAGLSVRELENGCICCTLKDDLFAILKDLMRNNPPDRIIIEPTGVFVFEDIFGIINDPKLNSRYKIGSVAAVCDAINFTQHQKRYNMFFKQQISHANSLYISKTDDMKAKDIIDIIESLQQIAPDADIIAKSLPDFTSSDWEALFHAEKLIEKHEHHSHCHHENESSHSGIKSVTIPCNRSFSKDELHAALKLISSNEFGEIPRAKGFVATFDNDFLLFDLVGKQISITPVGNKPRKTRGTFIGSGISKSGLMRLFNT